MTARLYRRLSPSKPQTTCSKCGAKPRASSQRWCKDCHADYMRGWREINGDPPRTWRGRCKKRAMDAIRYRLDHGEITRQDCETCGAVDTSPHHDDLRKPLEVRWLCKRHRRAWNANHIPPIPKRPQNPLS